MPKNKNLVHLTSLNRYGYVMWNLFTVGSLQFPNDSTIASLEANQNRPKIKNYVN